MNIETILEGLDGIMEDVRYCDMDDISYLKERARSALKELKGIPKDLLAPCEAVLKTHDNNRFEEFKDTLLEKLEVLKSAIV